ncbi:MAG: hypothetical protein DWI57_04645 [Chloroflexi bacterium]|nr:MAG: hypothetical protein DWI57_04645 [Chloroflexota bacterium]
MKHILTVCTANRCRSPLLTAVLRQRIAAHGLAEQITVSSAGLLARDGEAVDPVVLELLASRGLPLTEEYSRQLTFADIRQADLILVATEQHRLSLFHRSAENLYKVVLLSELIGGHTDLADPIGLPLSFYQRTLAEIERSVDYGWQRLCRLLSL